MKPFKKNPYCSHSLRRLFSRGGAITLSSVLILFLPLSIAAQQPTLTDVKVRFKDEKERQQVDKDATLSLDDSARRFVVKSKERPLEMNYDDVQKIIIELDSRAGKIGLGAGLLGFAVGGMLFGGQVAAKIDNPLKANHLVYVEYKDRDSKTNSFVLVLEKDSAPGGLKRIKAAFGDRVLVPAFQETREKLDKKQFKSSASRFQVRGSTQQPPLPDSRPDKALVVIAAPVSWGIKGVSTEKWIGWNAKIIVNDQVIAVNAPGTYTQFYLEPGEYLLVTQAMDITGLRIKLEAGRDYYLTQTIYIAGNIKSFLTRHSKEIVMHEVKDLLWAEWKPKN